MTVLDALARALRDLFNLRVLWVVVWPMLLALLLWLGAGRDVLGHCSRASGLAGGDSDC